MATKRIPQVADLKKVDTTQPSRPPPPLLLTPLQRYTAAADRLEEIRVMLHGLHRLHKNQHRVSTYWWPAFGQLRRHVRRLEEDVIPLKSMVKEGAGEMEPIDEEKRAIERARSVREDFVPKAYLAFSRLVADRRFAQLGLLLMGILAQVHTTLRWVSGDLATKKRRSDNENEEDDNNEDLAEDGAVESGALEVPSDNLEDDLGEVIARVEDSEEEDTKLQPSLRPIKKENVATTKPAKKRPRQEVDSDDDDGSHIKSLKSPAKPSLKSSDAEPVARSEKKRRVEEPGDSPIPRSTDKKELKEAKDSSEKRDKKDKKEKKEKEKDKSKKTKKKKKGGDEFDDLFSGLL
ncbi:Ribonuclease MRP protein subunit rmp1 [Sporothrix stenoceras]|uniref:Ribonuclease MRP protein subunit rmp1 n=1 Tax=Sporothrix stenoceras TaxID=5173 RepID=A0ABR3YNA0_9PEZI